jgi:CxxC-x17-CxxC domain-containing protein
MPDDIIKKAIDSGIAPFAVTTYRNREKVFGIKTDDRRRHVYLIGKTGMGKTTVIENMVYSDIMAGHGVCYIDPHGDTAEKMLEWIPNNRINDVIYFNPADIDFPISFNVLEKVDPHYRHLVASGLIGVFKKLWADSWGPRLEYILRNAILGLLEYPDSTLLGINRLMVDKNYRKKVVDKIQDPVVRSFWVDEFPKWNDRVLQEVISPIQNKVGQFLSTSLIRNVVGQVRSAVDLRKIMDEGKIVILNLSKGRIGEDASKLLGAMMVTKIQLAAMSRVDIPEVTRNDFYLYVDEFQNFATDSFADILSEARKYHLNLIIAHQYIEQLGEVVKPAVFGNVGTIICFRVGAEDAEFLEKEFMPFLTQEDLVNLPKYAIYLKLMIDGVASDPFSARGLPPVYGKSFGNEEKVIRASRERYAKPREIVEDKIFRWSLGDKADGDKDKNQVERPIVVDTFAKREEFGRPQGQGQGGARRDDRGSQRSGQRDDRPGLSLASAKTSQGKRDDRGGQSQGSRDDRGNQRQDRGRPGQSAGSSAQSPSAPRRDDRPQPAQTASKPMFAAKCDSCGMDVEVPFAPDKSRPVFCKDCLKKSRRGEIPVSELKSETEEKQAPTISLAQLNTQTVDFKGRPIKDGKEGHEGKDGLRRETPKVERPRVEPPPIRTAPKAVETKVEPKKEEVKPEVKQEITTPKIERPRVVPPPIKQPEPKKVIEPKAQVQEIVPRESEETILGDQEIITAQEAPKSKAGSVDFLQQFSGSDSKSDSKDIKEGEEVEL